MIAAREENVSCYYSCQAATYQNCRTKTYIQREGHELHVAVPHHSTSRKPQAKQQRASREGKASKTPPGMCRKNQETLSPSLFSFVEFSNCWPPAALLRARLHMVMPAGRNQIN